MGFVRRTPQLLHEDHQRTIEVVEALDRMIARAGRGMPDARDSANRSTLEKTANTILAEISNHFSFEETELFTRLEAAGDVAISTHLRDEHEAILPLGLMVAELARSALDDGFSDAGWASFRSAAGEMTERMLTHIQKEEMALLPMLDDLLEPEEDMELSTAYADAH